MEFNKICRRSFLKTAEAATAHVGMSRKLAQASTAMAVISNPMPGWRGFNLLTISVQCLQKENRQQ